MYDLILNNGLVFDGSGSPGRTMNLGIRDGVIVAMGIEPLADDGDARVIDVTGRWVMPGFIDNHTHYDAELLAAPGLHESVRHGVTTVVMGSCSLSVMYADAEDCSDIFTRVEALPRDFVLPLLQQKKTWRSAAGFIEHVEGLPLGPNVAAYAGHSDLRARVMGLGRAVDPREKPTDAELDEMEALLTEGLDAGLLGMSSMTNPWDKVDGDRFGSSRLPSTFARRRETKRLHKLLRRRGRILQSAPNLVTKYNAIAFALGSCSFFGLRRGLKTTLITCADTKSTPWIFGALRASSRVVNGGLGGQLRWQALPMPFEVYADGIDLVVFEEFDAGEEALRLRTQLERNKLLKTPEYRKRFVSDYETRFSPRVWQRDFYDAMIVSTPDGLHVGRSFGEVADERGVHPAEAFLDLVVEFGDGLRWRTTIANHRPEKVRLMLGDPNLQLGFSDAGAHLRNMAFYNFHLCALKAARDAADSGEPCAPVERVVQRLTGDIAEWHEIDAGALAPGRRADIAIIDPEGLNDDLLAYHEAPMDFFGGHSRMVRRNDSAVTATIINGEVVYENGVFAEGFGRSRRHGSFLRCGEHNASEIADGGAVSASLSDAAE